jgi:transcriptional regulator with XRE-family HTH domain
MPITRGSLTIDTSRWADIASSLSDKAYREAFVEQEIKVGVPFQIRALRTDRRWSQRKLGEIAGGMAQETVSQLENPNYGRMNIGTLLRLAAAFDCGLTVRFVPFSDLVDRAADVSPNALAVPSYANDKRLAGTPTETTTIQGLTSSSDLISMIQTFTSTSAGTIESEMPETDHRAEATAEHVGVVKAARTMAA